MPIALVRQSGIATRSLSSNDVHHQNVWRTMRRRTRSKANQSSALNFTTLQINNWINAKREGEDELMTAIYAHLSDIAHRQLRHGWRCEPLETTELVSELYLRLLRDKLPQIQNRSQFFGICALTARRILIERVRQYMAQSAGGRYVHTSVHDSMQVVNPTQEILLEIDQAMERLRKYDESKYLVASLRIYLGFSREEIAQALNTNLSKVKRDWKFASAWLAREVSRR